MDTENPHHTHVPDQEPNDDDNDDDADDDGGVDYRETRTPLVLAACVSLEIQFPTPPSMQTILIILVCRSPHSKTRHARSFARFERTAGPMLNDFYEK